MVRRWMLGGAALILAGQVLWARQGIVKTRDGQTFTGDVVEQQDQVVVDHKGIRTAIPRDSIRSVTFADTIEQEYRRRLARLTQYDVPGRLELAHWLFENKAYDLAEDVLQEALRLQPHNLQVADMLRTVDRQAELDRHEARKHRPVELAAADNNQRPDNAPPPRGPRGEAEDLLSPEQINFVKQNEWEEGQQVKNIKFENDVRRRYVAREGLNPAVFNRLPPWQQAWAIIHKGTDDMRQDVVIVGDPPVMLQFKRIEQSVLATCGNCHTPDKPAGNFALHMPATSEAATYTNFIILQRYTATIDKKKYYMINRDRPQDSLLIQFALPPDIGDPPHPKVANYKGVGRTRNDPRMRSLSDWISSLSPVIPDYSDLDVSSGKAATRPAAPPPPAAGSRRESPPPAQQR